MALLGSLFTMLVALILPCACYLKIQRTSVNLLQAFLAAWKAACTSTRAVKVVVPGGTYILGPVNFGGPCNVVPSITVQMQGTLKAVTDLNKYKSGWVEFPTVGNLTLTGGGTFDGQGEVSWPFNKCPTQKNCKVLPTSISFMNTKNTVVKNIKSLNIKFFHIALLGVQNFQGSGITITAPATSPNTDGIHMERNSGVSISHSTIGTGDDCVSIGQNNTDVSLTSITCGPGHGISVGSLGRYQNVCVDCFSAYQNLNQKNRGIRAEGKLDTFYSVESH